MTTGTAVHVVERWLDLSAGFVAAHVRQSRYDGVVVATKGWSNLDAFPHRPRHSLAVVDRMMPSGRAAGAGVLAFARLHRADLVHVHFGYPAHAALPAARRGLPLVLSLHGEDATGLLARHPHHYEPVIECTAAVVVPSPFFADVVADLGFDPRRIHVIPAGVDVDFFASDDTGRASAPIVAHVGRLVPKKGIDVLLAAWPAVRAAVPDARLHVLGDGPLRSSIPADPSIVHLLPDPTRRREQVRDVLSNAAVVAAPSRTAADGDAESLLLVNLEAMAMRRPVVSTRHGGIPSYLDDGVNGLLVPENDADALAGALVRVLCDPHLATGLADAGRRTAERFDARASTEAVDRLYDELTK